MENLTLTAHPDGVLILSVGYREVIVPTELAEVLSGICTFAVTAAAQASSAVTVKIELPEPALVR